MYSIIIGTVSLIIITGLWTIFKYLLSSSRNQNNTYLLGNSLNILNNKNSKNLISTPTFAILGPQYSGKTTLFNFLTTNKIRPFVTSQEISISSKNKNTNHNFTLIEFPGHIKLIYKWKSWLDLVTFNPNNYNSNTGSNGNNKNLKGIIFMIDSTRDFKSDASNDYWEQIAEWLIYILDKLEQLSHPTNLLIACNKNESFISRPPNKIKSFLEIKIGQVLSRKKSSMLIDPSNSNNYKSDITTTTTTTTTTANIITNMNERRYINGSDTYNEDNSNDSPLFDLFPDLLKFKFDSLETSVEVLGGSVLKQNIDPWKQWIEEHQ